MINDLILNFDTLERLKINLQIYEIKKITKKIIIRALNIGYSF